MPSGAVRISSFSLPYVPRMQEHVVQTLVCRMYLKLQLAICTSHAGACSSNFSLPWTLMSCRVGTFATLRLMLNFAFYHNTSRFNHILEMIL